MADEVFRIILDVTGRDTSSRALTGVNRGFQQMQTNMRSVNTEGRGLVTNMNGLERAATGFIAAFAGSQILQVVGDLRAMGDEARQAQARFEAMVGGPQLAADAMDMLREKTGGVVSDMRLTRDALSMLMTGVAGDVEEAGDIIKLGLQLAGQEGAATLGQALKNQSIELLDNVGISASQVRALSQQYRDAGMDASEAFTRATLEIGAGIVERLGVAADAGRTAFSQIQAAAEDAVVSIGGVFQQGIEAGSQLLLIASHGINQLQQQNDAAIAETQRRLDLMQRTSELIANLPSATTPTGEPIAGGPAVSSLSMGLGTSDQLNILADAGFVTELVNSAMFWEEQLQRNINTVRDLQIAYETFTGRVLVMDLQTTAALEAFLSARQQQIDFMTRSREQEARAAEAQLLREEQLNIASGNRIGLMLRYQARQAEFISELAHFQNLMPSQAALSYLVPEGYFESELAQMQNTVASVELLQQQLQQRTGEAFFAAQGRPDAIRRELTDLILQQRGIEGGQLLFSQEEATRADAIADRLEVMRDTLREMNVPPQMLADMEQSAAFARQQADQIQRGADILEGMSLSQLFGQAGGGRLGEIDEALLSALRESGAAETELEALTTALGLDTGQLTQASEQFENEILPLLSDIYAEMGTKAVIEAREAYLAAVEAERLAGGDMVVDPSTTGFIFNADGSLVSLPFAQMAGGEGGIGGAGGGGVAEMLGEFPAQMDAIAISSQSMLTSFEATSTTLPSVVESTSTLEKTMSAAKDHTALMGDVISTKIAGIHEVELNFKSNVKGLPPWLLSAIEQQVIIFSQKNLGSGDTTRAR